MLPTVSVLVAALVFLGPGALRPAVGVRVRGLPAEGARAVALRVEVVRSRYDVVDSGGAQEILVEASVPGQTLRAFHGTTGPDGIADVRLEAASPILRGPMAIGVSAVAPRPRLLAAGEVALRRPPAAFVQLGRVNGNVRGDLDVRVDAARGVLASPFPEVMRVRVSPKGMDVPLGARAEITVSGPGLDAAPAKLTTDERGAGAFTVRALAHQVELSLEVRAGDKSARWEGTLPVVPGAMWLSPPAPGEPGSAPKPSKPLALLSPAPKERAYVSFWSEEGRIGGAVVPLARDPQGFFAGEVTAPEAASRVLYATVAGDPLEQGAGTVAWPLQPAEGMVTPEPLALLVDGLPAALDREKQRAWTTRRSGLVLLGAAALAEVLLLLLQGRDAQRKLEAHLDEASAPLPEADRAKLIGASREHPLMRAVLAVALVGLAFAMLGALSTFR